VNRERIESITVEVTSEVEMNNRYDEIYTAGMGAKEHILGSTDVEIVLHWNFISAVGGILLKSEAEVLSSEKRGHTWAHRVWMGTKTMENAVEAVARFMEKNEWMELAGEYGVALRHLSTLEMRFLRSFPPEFPHLWDLVMHMLKYVGWEMIK